MIDVQALTYTYTGMTAPAVHDLTFTIARGEIFGFLGPSGAGKSTTQRILTGLLRGYQGSVTVLGRDLPAWGADLYEHIGVSFETPNHFQKLTALENLTYFGALYHNRSVPPRDLLALVDLQESADLLVAHYSKGMKNRLGVARALLHDPELLFLDEPTAGLDPVNARRIKDLIKAQQQAGKTVFLSTHDMAVAEELCDRVAFLVDGAIALIDTPHALKLRYGRPTLRVNYQVDGSDAMQQEFALENLGHNAAFLALLDGAHLETVHTQEATLENIFIQVTGRTL